MHCRSDTQGSSWMCEEIIPEGPEVAPYLSVVVPAYNEEARIGPTLARMLDYFETKPYSFEILVVDDGSNDATRDVVAEFASTHKQVRLLDYDENRGKGYAVRYGM